MASGCAPYYNTCKKGTANTRMERFYDEDNFLIYAERYENARLRQTVFFVEHTPLSCINLIYVPFALFISQGY